MVADAAGTAHEQHRGRNGGRQYAGVVAGGRRQNRDIAEFRAQQGAAFAAERAAWGRAGEFTGQRAS